MGDEIINVKPILPRGIGESFDYIACDEVFHHFITFNELSNAIIKSFCDQVERIVDKHGDNVSSLMAAIAHAYYHKCTEADTNVKKYTNVIAQMLIWTDERVAASQK